MGTVKNISGWWVPVILGFCAVLLFSGCSFGRLREDLQEIGQLKIISGRIVGAAENPKKPVVSVLWSVDEGEGQLSGYWVVQPSGEFLFGRASGRYYLFAFEDSNEDFDYQDDEKIAVYGSPTLIDLNSTKNYENLLLELKPKDEIAVPDGMEDLADEEIEGKFSWRKNQVGLLTTMDNPDFSHDVAVLGLWQPLAFAERYGMKIYFLEPYDPEKIPVLFVHGASGHPAVWKNMAEQLDRSRFQPWFLFYPSGVWLDMLGSASASYLEELRLQHHFDELIVVAHSMGGLVARDMIQKYAQQTDRCRIPGFITLATPWQGHNAASIGIRFAPAVVPSWMDLSPGSEFLQKLFEKPLPPETDHSLFFSYRKSLGTENNDGAVTLDSQLFLQAQDEAARVTGFHAGHADILSEPAAIDRLNRVLDGFSKQRAGDR